MKICWRLTKTSSQNFTFGLRQMLLRLKGHRGWYIVIFCTICLASLTTPPLYSQHATGVEITSPAKETLPPDVNEILKSPIGGFGKPSLISQGAALSLLALMPYIIMILTSFTKIVIVLSLLRSALGVQQAPPNQIINGIALLLSLYIMYPTAAKMYDAGLEIANKYGAPESLFEKESPQYIMDLAQAAAEPLRVFLKNNSATAHHKSFFRIAYRVLPESHRETLKPDSLIVLVPAYITSQLKDAFEIGVLIYIPFFVIDLVTSNILLAMGMMMLSPVTISMPLKLFLLVMLDGWSLLIEGLVNTFH